MLIALIGRYQRGVFRGGFCKPTTRVDERGEPCVDPVTDASAESSPAPLSGSDFLASLTESERHAFFESSPEQRVARMAKPEGAKPAQEPDASAASSPAQPVEQAASTDASPDAASETAKPAKTDTKGLDARETAVRERLARLKDDLAETTRLERELASRQARLQTPETPKPDAAAESSTAAAKRVFEQYVNDPKAPKLESYDDYNAWAIDMMDYVTDRKLDARETQAQQRSAEHAKQRELDSAVQTSSQRVKAFAEKTPDFESRVRPELLNIVPVSALKDGDPIGPHNFIAEQMWRSEYPGELALHFSEHPEEFQALMALPDPAAITRRIGRIEARFESSNPDRQSRETKPVPKTIPDADELPVVIGKKAPVTTSDTEAALKSRDFSAYERARKREWGLKD